MIHAVEENKDWKGDGSAVRGESCYLWWSGKAPLIK